jgi:hypothetical protein
MDAIALSGKQTDYRKISAAKRGHHLFGEEG